MSFFSTWKTKWDAFKEFCKEVSNWKQVALYLIKGVVKVAVIWLVLEYSAGSAYKIVIDAIFGG